MLENKISTKLREITFRKVSLEARIAEEESKRRQEEINDEEEINVEDKIDRLKRLQAIYTQFEDLLQFMRGGQQYNS
jgi:hypothetical protein